MAPRRTKVRARHEVERDALLIGEEPVMGTEPRAVLRVRARVVRQPAKSDIAPDRSEIPAGGVDDVVYPLCQTRINEGGRETRS